MDSKDVFEGSNFIGKNAVVKDCQIGFASYVAYESQIEHCQIGKYCCIGPYVRTITGKHPIEFAAMHPFFYAKKNQIGESYVDITKYEEHDYIDNEKHYQVFIGNDVWIGNGAKIMAGVHIGDGAVVAADALIVKDVEPYNKYTKYMVFVGAGVNLVLNFFFIQWWGIVGAAVTTLISQIVVSLIAPLFWKKTRGFVKIYFESFKRFPDFVDTIKRTISR